MSREILARSIICKSNLPSADYVVNPYVGCSHACIYCYARFMKRFTGHDEAWGQFVDVKVNGAALVPKQSSRYQGKTLFLSSVTDPYLHLEKKYQLTRAILQALVPLQPKLEILTKSDLVVRDMDVLGSFASVSVGLSLSTLDDAIRKEIEPRAAGVNERISALVALKEHGIRTYVFVGPIVPHVTDWREIVRATRPYADRYMFENLNTRGDIGKAVNTWIIGRYGAPLPFYQMRTNEKRDYWERTETEIRSFIGETGIDGRVFFHH